MKFQLISDGSIPVPPINGWGALERVVWSYKNELEKLGHDVIVSNYLDDIFILEDYRRFKPDIVHNHLGKHWAAFSLLSPKICKIFTNHGGGFRFSNNFWQTMTPFLRNAYGFVLTDDEYSFFTEKKISCSIVPNGVYVDDISFNNEAEFDRSIYLGKIMSLKRQAFFQKIGLDVIYVGNPEDKDFNYQDPNYLGSWNYEQVKFNLTKFSNLVLLSLDELQPLVCLEAMSAGLGLVISEPAAQSLDCSLPWITVIKEENIKDINYVNNAVLANKEISTKNRIQIREYAKTFDWKNIVKKYTTLINNYL